MTVAVAGATVMPFIPSQLRVAAKCLVVQRRHPIMHIRHRDRDHHYWHRSFSSTPRQEAAEDPDSILTQMHSSPIMQKILDKPEALKALHDFANIMKETDVTITADRPPSMMQMFKLAANPKFREGAKRVVEELRKAGIEINQENALELFGMKKPPPGQ